MLIPAPTTISPAINCEMSLIKIPNSKASSKTPKINIIPEDKVGYNNYEFEYPNYNNKISDINNNESKEYKTQMSKLSFMPKILFDYGTVKPGIYYSSFDLLNQISLFGALSINSQNRKYEFLFENCFRKEFPAFKSRNRK